MKRTAALAVLTLLSAAACKKEEAPAEPKTSAPAAAAPEPATVISAVPSPPPAPREWRYRAEIASESSIVRMFLNENPLGQWEERAASVELHPRPGENTLDVEVAPPGNAVVTLMGSQERDGNVVSMELAAARFSLQPGRRAIVFTGPSPDGAAPTASVRGGEGMLPPPTVAADGTIDHGSAVLAAAAPRQVAGNSPAVPLAHSDSTSGDADVKVKMPTIVQPKVHVADAPQVAVLWRGHINLVNESGQAVTMWLNGRHLGDWRGSSRAEIEPQDGENELEVQVRAPEGRVVAEVRIERPNHNIMETIDALKLDVSGRPGKHRGRFVLK